MSVNMKLAEALSVRTDLQTRIEWLGCRLQNNSQVQEGNEPNEDPDAMLAELDDLCAQLEDIIGRINTTNSVTRTADGRTLVQLLAHREVTKHKVKILRDLIDSGSMLASRHSATEIRNITTVNIRDLRKTADRLSEDVRKTDMLIQELNWTTELQ